LKGERQKVQKLKSSRVQKLKVESEGITDSSDQIAGREMVRGVRLGGVPDR
jgi:hypothetical protein